MAETDWDDDGPVLAANLAIVLKEAARAGLDRSPVTSAHMARWHKRIMQGLVLPNSGDAGCFRGSGAARSVEVTIGGRRGVLATRVGEELARFDDRLTRAIARLDDSFPDALASEAALTELLTLCAWAHGEWIRIHPFANGSGRTARLWVNALAMRYGVPPFMRLRPRPGADYERAAARAMNGEWKAAMPVLRQLLHEELDRR